MRAEVIAIGDEITSGQLLDRNTQWLSRRLEAMGVRVAYHTALCDEIEPLARGFRQAFLRADVVVATGGIGPTADDLTREALAEASGRKLVENHHALEGIRRLYARWNREMPKQNERQAYFPEGASVIANPHGTAPGIALEVPREGAAPCRVFALPGVPAEMRQMWEESVAVALCAVGAGARMVVHRRIQCFGAGESDVEAMLPDLIRRGRTPRVGINASQGTIILRVTAEGATEPECLAAIEPTVASIRKCLGTRVFGEGDDELHHAVARLLGQKKKTLAVAEWGTGGMISHWFGELPEAERLFLGGMVVNSSAALHRVLGVAEDLVSRHAPTSEAVARAMAVGCRERFGADFGLAVPRFPEFDPKAAEPKTLFVGLALGDGVHATPFPYAGHPALLKVLAAKRAVNLVRLALLGVPGQSSLRRSENSV